MSLSPRRRLGAAVMELVVALTIFAIIGTACLRTLAVSSYWHEHATLSAEQRAQLEAARALLNALPAAASPAAGDVLAASDTALTWMATIGSGVVCNLGAGTAAIPRAPLAGIDHSAVGTTPQPGDALLVFDDGPGPAPADDRWIMHAISGVHSSPGACVGGPLADSVLHATSPAWRLDLSPAPGPESLGAPARFLRPQRLALYRSTGEWMLGLADFNGVTWSAIQPAAGPLAAAGGSAPGLELRWVDSLLAPNPAAPAMAHATLRAPTRRVVRRAGAGPTVRLDSLGFVVGLRNRR